MSLSGKKFTDLSSGRVLEIRDSFEDIAVATDGTKLSVRRLMDRNYFDEYIDPKSFTTNESFLSTFANMIKNIPNDALTNMQENIDTNNISGSTTIRPIIEESAVLPYDPEEERMELLRKAQTMYPDSSEQLRRQMESLSKIIGDDEDLPVIPQQIPRPINNQEEVIQRVEVNRDEPNPENRFVETDIPKNRMSTQPKQEDPIIAMFKNVKRNNEFKISLDISNKIPRNDFIEMMEDSYNTSIIEYLADEFTNDLLSDPSKIREKIIAEIKRIVYGDKLEVKKTITKRATKKVTKPNLKKPSPKAKKDLSNDNGLDSLA